MDLRDVFSTAKDRKKQDQKKLIEDTSPVL